MFGISSLLTADTSGEVERAFGTIEWNQRHAPLKVTSQVSAPTDVSPYSRALFFLQRDGGSGEKCGDRVLNVAGSLPCSRLAAD